MLKCQTQFGIVTRRTGRVTWNTLHLASNAFDEIYKDQEEAISSSSGIRSPRPRIFETPISAPHNVSSPPSPAPSVAHSNPFPPCRLTNRPSTSFFYIFYPDHSCPPLQLLHLPRTHNPKHSPPPTVQHHPPNIASMCPRNDGI